MDADYNAYSYYDSSPSFQTPIHASENYGVRSDVSFPYFFPLSPPHPPTYLLHPPHPPLAFAASHSPIAPPPYYELHAPWIYPPPSFHPPPLEYRYFGPPSGGPFYRVDPLPLQPESVYTHSIGGVSFDPDHGRVNTALRQDPRLPTLSSPTALTSASSESSSALPNVSQDPRPRSHWHNISYKTTACRHFVKNKGWCPMGDRCGYIHDLSFPTGSAPENRNNGHTSRAPFPSPRSTTQPVDQSAVSGGVRVGTKKAHCWAYVQGHCRYSDCQYLHPQDITPYIPYTPCLKWPRCPRARGYHCAFRHPDEPEPPRSSLPPQSPPASSPALVPDTSHVPRTFGLSHGLARFAGATGSFQFPAPRPGTLSPAPSPIEEEPTIIISPAAPPSTPTYVSTALPATTSPGPGDVRASAAHAVPYALSAYPSPAPSPAHAHHRRASISAPEMVRSPQSGRRGHARRISVNIQR